MAATPFSTRRRRREALLAALGRNRGEVDPRRLARLLSECGPTVPAPRPVTPA
jgi:hypothetical protein